VTTSKDANYQITTYQYGDALARLTRVDLPDGGWTSYWYDRNAHGNYVGTHTAINATQKTESYQFFDGLGRAVRSFSGTARSGSPPTRSTMRWAGCGASRTHT
jgi:YD repeat-containing protein